MSRNIIHIDNNLCVLYSNRVVSGLNKNYREYALFMKALSDETRFKIFDMLSKRDLCACKILEELDITQPTLSYHMKIMSESGLVDSMRDGIWMKYSINRGKLQAISEMFNSLSEIIDSRSNGRKY